MDRYKTIINRKNIIILVSILIVCAGMFLFKQIEDIGFAGFRDNRKALETYVDVYGGNDFATTAHAFFHQSLALLFPIISYWITTIQRKASMSLL